MNWLTKNFLRVAMAAILVQGFVVVAAPVTFAAETTFTPEISLPGQFSGPQTVDENLFGRYVRAIYIYFIWTVGVVATGMVIYAGVKWVAAAGNQAKIKDARDMITNAIIGVIIGLTSVVLLNLLSPSFTTLQIPQLTLAKKNYYAGAAATDVCPREKEINCGDLLETGKKVFDSQGKEIPEFCMGTQCIKGKICSLALNVFPRPVSTTGDWEGDLSVIIPAAGCIGTIPMATTQPPAYTSVASLTVDEFGKCGEINPSKTRVGASCGESLNDKKGICYITTVPAKAVDQRDPDVLLDVSCKTP